MQSLLCRYPRRTLAMEVAQENYVARRGQRCGQWIGFSGYAAIAGGRSRCSLVVRDLEQVQNQSAVIATRKGAASLMSETKSMLVISSSGKGFSQVLLKIRSDPL